MAEASPDYVHCSKDDNCDLCDKEREVSWYCPDCRQKLCVTCEAVHSKSTASRFHNVIPVQSSPRPVSWTRRYSVASDFIGETKEIEICLLHKSEICTEYCNLCELFVCGSCIRDSHRTHHTLNISEAAESKLLDLNKKLQALEHYQSDRLIKKINDIENDKVRYLNKLSDQRHEVREQNEKLIVLVNDVTDALLQEIDIKEQVDLQFLARKENRIQEILRTYRRTAELCRENVKHKKGVSLIKQCKESDQILGKLEMSPEETDACTTPPEFIPGKVDKEEIQKMFGELNFLTKNVRLCRKLTFAFPKSIHAKVIGLLKQKPRCGVYCLTATSNGNAILGTGEPSIQVVNTFGKIIASIKIDAVPFSITCTQYGEDVYLSSRTMSIRHLSDGSFSTFIHTSPFIVQGLCVDGDDQLLACLYSKEEKYGKVVRYSKQGTVLQQYVYNEKQELIFKNPEKIAVGMNVIYVVDTEMKCVFAIDVSGDIKFIYRSSQEKRFEPNCIARGPMGSILVGDKSGDKIHLLDKNGQYLLNAMEKEQGISEVLSISTDLKTDKLWASCYDKVIVAALET